MTEVMIIDDILCFVEWRPIIVNGIKTNYEVSDNGKVRNVNTGKILKYWIDRDGYYRTTISVNKKSYHTGTHRFVAIAFIPNPNNLPEVNHKNGKKWDNSVENLEWVTTQENVQHAFDTGLKSAIKGEDNSLSTYTEKQIRKVCKMLEKGISNKKISEKTGVERKYITDIKKGRRWKHISKEYNFKQNKYSEELKEAILKQLAQKKTPKVIINELNLPNNQASVSLIERLKRVSLNDYLLMESRATS